MYANIHYIHRHCLHEGTATRSITAPYCTKHSDHVAKSGGESNSMSGSERQRTAAVYVLITVMCEAAVMIEGV